MSFEGEKRRGIAGDFGVDGVDRFSGGEKPHMDWDEFRRLGREVIDWIADYHENIEQHPVMSRVQPGEIREMLPDQPPERGEAFESILEDVNRIVLPGLTHWQSPNFFAFFPANTSGPSILGELLSAGLGVQGMLWQTSPACTELETHVLDWLVGMLGLPERFLSSGAGGGVIQDSASSACLCAVIAARHRALRANVRTVAPDNRSPVTASVDRLVAYCSEHAHSSVEKALRIAGIPTENLRHVTSTGSYAMDSEALARDMRADRKSGFVPFFVCATVGTTSSHAVDPVAEIAEIARLHTAWVHVDAAMVGPAAVCEEFRYINNGLEAVDSYCFNPHKWMFTNFDCDCFYVAQKSVLIEALSVLPEYLRNAASEAGHVIDYRDWQVPLGRRFRSLKLWFVLRYYGRSGVAEHIRAHVALAQEFAEWVDAHREFEVVAPHPFNLVCFRHSCGDEFNRRLEKTLNDGGSLYLTHTELDGHYTLRMSIGQTSTSREHVVRAWATICSACERLNASDV